ncbi:alanine/glycine:cation symporter family protein [Ruminococcus flavefaciens]|uniref:alanine/glycine:cation symporter family protein n=1 Tax=Ruminococcus flavefaciens TaxID=1265 RepID=UPI0004B4C483|nr:amino acid carrier protein [Ruminococcus flavefaciens]
MLERINDLIWGKGLILLLLLIGVIYTVKLRAIQFRLIPYMIKTAHNKEIRKNQFKTMCVSLGAAMGTGNITGVASAIVIGGAGAIFWMWISAFLGMATVYAENNLSSIYSDKSIKGPMAYLAKGAGSMKLAICFAFCCILASFGMGGMVQANAMSECIRKCLKISPFLLSIIVFIVVLAVICGGAKRIERAAQIFLPFATILYTAICISVIWKTRSNLPNIIIKIFYEAFGIRQCVGGVSGYSVSKAVSSGIRRGVFSNEAGLGSSPILHSSSVNSNDIELQGMCSMFEVFIDTIICCTLTAFTILCASSNGTVYEAFDTATGKYSCCIIAVLMTAFAFCTIIGWYYCGETAFIFLHPNSSKTVFSFAFSLVTALGVIIKAEKAWTISDIFNGLMAFFNIIGLFLLINKVKGIKISGSVNK